MKNLLTTFAVGSTVSILFSCATLPDIDKSICGDGVLQVGEDCDPLATQALASWAGTAAKCAGQVQALACKYVAPAREACPNPSPKGCPSDCPVGWGLSVAGACVKPSSGFTQDTVLVEPTARSFRGGDFDGDGVSDLAFISAGRMHAIYGDLQAPFETGRSLSKAIQSGPVANNRLKLSLEPALTSGDVSEDGADDLVLIAPELGGGNENDHLSVNIGTDDSFLTSVIPTYRIEELVGRGKTKLEDDILPRRRQKLLQLRGTFLNEASKPTEGTGVFVFAPNLAMPLLRTTLAQFGLEPTLPPLEIPYTVARSVQSMKLSPLSTCDIAFIPSKDANAMYVLPLPSCPDSPSEVKEFKLTGVSNIEAYTVYDYDRDGRNDLVIRGSQGNDPAVLWLRGQGTADSLTFAPPARADRFYEGATPHMPFAVLEDGPNGLLFLEKEGDAHVWSRDNSGAFRTLYQARGKASQVEVGNFDGEGPLDVWVVEGSNAVFIKAKSASEVKVVNYALSAAAVQMDAGDLDGDGVSDLVLRVGDAEATAAANGSVKQASSLFFFYGTRFGFPENPVLAGTIPDVDDILVAPRSVPLLSGPNVSGDLVYAVGRTEKDVSLQTLISVSGSRVVSSEFTPPGDNQRFSSATFANFGTPAIVAFLDGVNGSFSVLRYSGGVLSSIETPTSATLASEDCFERGGGVSTFINPDGNTPMVVRLGLPDVACKGALSIVELKNNVWSQRSLPTDQRFRSEEAALPPRMRVADVDGDGLSDLLILYNGDNNGRVLEVRRGAAGGLAEPVRITLGKDAVDFETIQRRESKARDIAVASNERKEVSFYEWSSNTTLIARDVATIEEQGLRGGNGVRSISELITGDIDGDGREDLSILVVGGNRQLVLLRGGNNAN